MDPTWLELAKQAPVVLICLGAFIYLVRICLLHIKEEGADNRAVIKENSAVIGQCKEMFGRCAVVLDRHDRENGRR